MKGMIAALAVIFVLTAAALLIMNASMALDLYDVQAIRLTHNESGRTAEITDTAEIEAITDELNAARYEKRGQAESVSGAYTITIIQSDGTTTELHISEYTLIRDGECYVIADDRGVNTKVFDTALN